MKLESALFVHSHIFIYDLEGSVYSEGKLTYSTWLRYLNHFQELYVAGRSVTKVSIENLNISNGPKVKFTKLPNITSIKTRLFNRRNAINILNEKISKVDVVIARLPSAHGMLAVNIAKKLKKPYVIELVGDPYDALWNHGSIAGKLLAPFASFNVKKTLNNAPYVLYVTKTYLQQRYPSKKSRVIINCSNVELTISENSCIAKKYELFTIGLIGSYTSKYKGIDDALNVVAMLRGKGIKVILRILGSGESREILKNAKDLGILEQVKLDGSLPAGEDVYNWLKRLDLYIQPSLTEGLPRSLIEAMYCKCPCIASNVGGIPELIDSTYLHNPKDTRKLCALIELMYKNKEIRIVQGEVNHAKSLNYTKEVLDAKREEFWNNIICDVEESKI